MTRRFRWTSVSRPSSRRRRAAWTPKARCSVQLQYQSLELTRNEGKVEPAELRFIKTVPTDLSVDGAGMSCVSTPICAECRRGWRKGDGDPQSCAAFVPHGFGAGAQRQSEPADDVEGAIVPVPESGSEPRGEFAGDDLDLSREPHPQRPPGSGDRPERNAGRAAGKEADASGKLEGTAVLDLSAGYVTEVDAQGCLLHDRGRREDRRHDRHHAAARHAVRSPVGQRRNIAVCR